MNQSKALRVGVVFGGRSSEHEVSLASARNVIDALAKAGHTVVPIGITPQGRWLTAGNPLGYLSERQGSENAEDAHNVEMVALNGHSSTGALYSNGVNGHQNSWALLPQGSKQAPLPSIDVLFPVLHGPYGEDGTIQGLLEMANLPYVGCGVLASAVCMDKAMAKVIFAAAGLPQVAYQVVARAKWRQNGDMVMDEMEQVLGYPVFVKPANLGSSVGISKARNRNELQRAFDLAAHYDRKLIVEQAVPHARELEVSVLGNDEPIASIPGEIVPGNEFYDYAAKYLDDNSDLIIPAKLSAAQVEALQSMALTAFKATDGSGLARVDFLMNDQTGEIFLNEINTLPGFTRISMYPKLWEASGISYPMLVDRLLQLALARHEERQENQTTRSL